MECVKNGQLKNLIAKRKREKKSFSDQETAIIMKSISSALNYIHSKDIVHRDLKPGFYIYTKTIN